MRGHVILTRFINSSEVNRDVLNQHYEIDSSLISNLYQPQTSISNTYVLTFSDEVLKAITNYVENNPIRYLIKRLIIHKLKV